MTENEVLFYTVLVLFFNFIALYVNHRFCVKYEDLRKQSNITLKECLDLNEAIKVNIKANDIIYKKAQELICKHDCLKGKFKQDAKKISIN